MTLNSRMQAPARPYAARTLRRERWWRAVHQHIGLRTAEVGTGTPELSGAYLRAEPLAVVDRYRQADPDPAAQAQPASAPVAVQVRAMRRPGAGSDREQGE